MIDWNKYIGKPYVFNGRDLETGVDCVGLIYCLYKDQGWAIDFDDGQEILPDWFERDKFRFARYMLKHFDRADNISQLQEGDIIFFDINGESHVGIYCGYGKFLSTFPKVSTFNGGISFLDRLKYWTDNPYVKITGLFKRR